MSGPDIEDNAASAGESPEKSGAFSILGEPTARQRKAEAGRIMPSGSDRAGDLAEQVDQAVLRLVEKEFYHGPLPHPKHLEAYERIMPGTAGRIIAMAEKQQMHRIHFESRALIFDLLYSYSGLVFGLCVALLLIAGAYFSARSGHDGVALAFLAASAIGIVGSLIEGRKVTKGPGDTPSTIEKPKKSL